MKFVEFVRQLDFTCFGVEQPTEAYFRSLPEPEKHISSVFLDLQDVVLVITRAGAENWVVEKVIKKEDIIVEETFVKDIEDNKVSKTITIKIPKFRQIYKDYGYFTDLFTGIPFVKIYDKWYVDLRKTTLEELKKAYPEVFKDF